MLGVADIPGCLGVGTSVYVLRTNPLYLLQICCSLFLHKSLAAFIQRGLGISARDCVVFWNPGTVCLLPQMFPTVCNVAICNSNKGAPWFPYIKTQRDEHFPIHTQAHVLSEHLELFLRVYYSKFPENFLKIKNQSIFSISSFCAQREGLWQETNAVIYPGRLILCLTSPQWHFESVGALFSSGESLKITICLSL